MTIKHLVLSGGGPSMIQTLGAIQHLEKKNIIQRANIQSIYGTSAGAIVGVLYCFQFVIIRNEMVCNFFFKKSTQRSASHVFFLLSLAMLIMINTDLIFLLQILCVKLRLFF